MTNSTSSAHRLAWLERPDGSIHWLKDLCSIGRLADNQFQIDHPTVGRRHATIERTDGEFRIVDLRSINGTRVNGRAAAPFAELNDHDVIRLSANVAFVFRCCLPEPRTVRSQREETVIEGTESAGYVLVAHATAAGFRAPGGAEAFILELCRLARRHGGEVESFWNNSALCIWKVKDPGDSSALACGIELLQLPGCPVERFCLHYGPVTQYQSEKGRLLVSDAAEFCVASASAMRSEEAGSILTDAAAKALGLERTAHALRTRRVPGFPDQRVFYTLGRDFKDRPKTLGRRAVVFSAPETPVYFGLSKAVMDDTRFVFLGFSPDPKSAILAAKRKGAELLVVDLALPFDVLVLPQDAASVAPDLKLLGVMARAEDDLGMRALQAGYKGLILEGDPVSEFLTAMHALVLGNGYVSPAFGAGVRTRGHHTSENTLGGLLRSLGDREWEVFRLVGLDLQNVEIAKSLGISIKTVESHVKNIASKIGATGTEGVRLEAKKWQKGR